VSAISCSQASEEVDEPLAGTAVESTDTWFLLEVNDVWAPKAIETEALSGDVRSKLERWQEAAPRSRLQLIRRPRRGSTGIRFAVVRTDPRVAATTELDGLHALLDLDFDRFVQSAVPMTEPICLVCVHGRRDRCCAQHGAAVFRALCAHDLDLWQTSHLGGHRFAACLLWLPEGLMYGRLRPGDVDTLVAARARGEVGDLERLRGRCTFDRPTQAAEIVLRRRLGELRADAFRWVSTTEPEPDTWHVRFAGPDQEHEVVVSLEDAGVTRPASCGKEPEPVSRLVERRRSPTSHYT